jgi:hypothetical protein
MNLLKQTANVASIGITAKKIEFKSVPEKKISQKNAQLPGRFLRKAISWPPNYRKPPSSH